MRAQKAASSACLEEMRRQKACELEPKVENDMYKDVDEETYKEILRRRREEEEAEAAAEPSPPTEPEPEAEASLDPLSAQLLVFARQRQAAAARGMPPPPETELEPEAEPEPEAESNRKKPRFGPRPNPFGAAPSRPLSGFGRPRSPGDALLDSLLGEIEQDPMGGITVNDPWKRAAVSSGAATRPAMPNYRPSGGSGGGETDLSRVPPGPSAAFIKGKGPLPTRLQNPRLLAGSATQAGAPVCAQSKGQ